MSSVVSYCSSAVLILIAYFINLTIQGAITKRMTAIEEMAGMDVLCSDKTGTLTLNKLTVDKNLVEVRMRVHYNSFTSSEKKREFSLILYITEILISFCFFLLNFQVFAKGVDADTVVLMAARASRTENQDAIDTAIVGMLSDPKEVNCTTVSIASILAGELF